MVWIERLEEMLHRGSDHPPAPDWSAIESTWGIRFPSDYKWFCETYGPGGINDVVGIFRPMLWDDPRSTMVRRSRSVRSSFEDFRVTHPDRIFGVRGDPVLVAWGSSDLADDFCWDTSGENPDSWPVVVSVRDDYVWRQFDMSFSEFLVRAMLDDLDGWDDRLAPEAGEQSLFEPDPETIF